MRGSRINMPYNKQGKETGGNRKEGMGEEEKTWVAR